MPFLGASGQSLDGSAQGLHSGFLQVKWERPAWLGGLVPLLQKLLSHGRKAEPFVGFLEPEESKKSVFLHVSCGGDWSSPSPSGQLDPITIGLQEASKSALGLERQELLVCRETQIGSPGWVLMFGLLLNWWSSTYNQSLSDESKLQPPFLQEQLHRQLLQRRATGHPQGRERALHGHLSLAEKKKEVLQNLEHLALVGWAGQSRALLGEIAQVTQAAEKVPCRRRVGST